MTPLGDLIDWANAVLAAAAGVVNVYAGRRGMVAVKWVRYMVGVLAFIYSAAYLWLLLGDVGVETWSNWVRGLGPVAWVVAWMLPAVVGLRFAKRVDRATGVR